MTEQTKRYSMTITWTDNTFNEYEDIVDVEPDCSLGTGRISIAYSDGMTETFNWSHIKSYTATEVDV